MNKTIVNHTEEVLSVTSKEIIATGRAAVCDHCGKATSNGYWIPDRRESLCQGCFAVWDKEAV